MLRDRVMAIGIREVCDSALYRRFSALVRPLFVKRLPENRVSRKSIDSARRHRTGPRVALADLSVW